MDNSTYNDEQLMQYLDGELSGVEKVSLEEKLAKDGQLQEQYDSLLLTREAIRQYGLKVKVAGIHQEMMTKLPQPVKSIKPVRKIYRLTAVVAAGIILLVAGLWLYNFYTLSAEKLYSDNYKYYELSTVRDANNTLTDIERAYTDKNYKEVIRMHDIAASRSAKTEFLCGLSAMELNDNPTAIKCFKEVLQLNAGKKPATLQDEAEYYLSLSYLRNGDYEYSLDLLEKIKSDPEHIYSSRVTKKLLRQLRLLKWR